MEEKPGPYLGNRRRFKAALETQMPGELQFLPQLIPREPLLIFPLKSAGEIVQLLKKTVDEPQEKQESESVLNKTAALISESQYMLYRNHNLKVQKSDRDPGILSATHEEAYSASCKRRVDARI